MHPQCMEGRVRGNIHGHMHAHVVMRDRFGADPVQDNRYFNACVEQINYTPVTINSIIEARGWGDPI